jgi:hypothetical protein
MLINLHFIQFAIRNVHTIHSRFRHKSITYCHENPPLESLDNVPSSVLFDYLLRQRGVTLMTFHSSSHQVLHLAVSGDYSSIDSSLTLITELRYHCAVCAAPSIFTQNGRFIKEPIIDSNKFLGLRHCVAVSLSLTLLIFGHCYVRNLPLVVSLSIKLPLVLTFFRA